MNDAGKNEPVKPRKVKEKLQTKLFGKAIHYFSEVGSTNNLAKELASLRAREGTVIVAGSQTGGKGRSGRTWASPKGGLWFSTILRPKLHPREIPKLTIMSSLAVAKTISQLYNLEPEVKWPNDVLINAKKVCGILTEAKTSGDTTSFVIVGIGINANIELQSLPEQVRAHATSLRHELPGTIDCEQLLHVLLEKMEHYYVMLQNGKFHSVLVEWKRLCRFLGSYVEVMSGKKQIEGWATDVDRDGALILKLQDGTSRRILLGDVNIGRGKGQGVKCLMRPQES